MSRASALDLLRFTRAITDGLFKDFPEAKWTYQPSPTDNHALWTLGHLASTDAWICGVVGAPGASMPDGYDKLFGMGSKPVDDPAAYPKPADVMKVMHANRAALLAWLEKTTPEQLAKSTKEATGNFMNDAIDGALKIGWHEGWHCGQLAGIRKALGLKNVIG